MKIGVISDTHGNVPAFRRALELFSGADLIIHAGDVLYHPPRLSIQDGYDIPAFVDLLNNSPIPILIAQGNCDPQVYEELLDIPSQSPCVVAEMSGARIVANHGHLLTREMMANLGRKYKANYVISGHTHVPVLEDVGGVILMNPGSPAFPKFEIDGRPVPSVGIIDDSGARIVRLDDGSTILAV